MSVRIAENAVRIMVISESYQTKWYEKAKKYFDQLEREIMMSRQD
jgi:hypothetical protein